MLDRELILVFGKQGMGKTRWTRAFLARKKRVLFHDPIGEYDAILFDDLEEMLNHVTRYRTFRVKTQWREDFPNLCAIAMVAGNAVLTIEESNTVLRPWDELPRPFEEVIFRGRHPKVSLILVSQRPSTVHIHARSQWTRLIAFSQTEGTDLKWLGQQLKVDEADIPALGPGEYFEARFGAPTEKKILTDQRAFAMLKASERG